MTPYTAVAIKAKSLLGFVAPSLLPFKLKAREGATIYNSQRVIRQFGYDKDAFSLTWELAALSAFEARFVGRGKEQILAGTERLFYPGWTAWD